MTHRLLLGASLALVLAAAPAGAAERGLLSAFKPSALPGVSTLLGGRKSEPTVQLAQSGDPRITALEEQVRSLSGTVEELNFQILQMQEQMRKMQEDTEFRFQQLEGGSPAGGSGSGAAAPAKRKSEVAPPAPPAAGTAAPQTTATRQPGTVEDAIASGASVETPAATGVSGRSMGTITFDDKGNVTGGGIGDEVTTSPAPAAGGVAAGSAAADQTIVAALPPTDDPEELYRNSYEFILSGDYKTAEAGFRDHIARFPTDAKTADARFWLGESLLGQKRYRDAAETFLSANKEYPSSRKAPDMLLKLGVALVGLDQKDVACATFIEVTKRYPEISGALKERLKKEQANAAC